MSYDAQQPAEVAPAMAAPIPKGTSTSDGASPTSVVATPDEAAEQPASPQLELDLLPGLTDPLTGVGWA